MIRLSRFALALFALLATTLALADPPARVGRLALVENGVNFHADRDDPGGAASINWPISSGALLDTERHGRAEVWIGSTAFRLGGHSQLEFSLVDDRQVNVQLLNGSLAVSIFDRDQATDLSVATPDGRVSFASPGRYRIDVFSDHTELTSVAGSASFSDGERDTPVGAGQKASVYSGGRIRVERDVDQDSFDYWVTERENAALASASRRYVSPAMTGYQDLDNYGDWTSQSEYGAVWYPRDVADDWAPYRFGRWVWVAPWGWTWVDQSPWGFAPFHYGRWVTIGGRWGWVPGRYVARPVYAPALVAWIGNPGWSVGFRSGTAPAVGWFPLAPHEVYVPGFQATARYVHQVNQTQVHDVALVDRAIHGGAPANYAYRALPQAVTVIPASQLREGRPITAAEIGRHDRHDLDRAPPPQSAPDKALVPPPSVRPLRDERREAMPLRGRPADARAPQRNELPLRPAPGAADQRARENGVLPLPNREDARRGGPGREPASVVVPAGREALPNRPPEAVRSDIERRPVGAGSQPIPASGREMRPDGREAPRSVDGAAPVRVAPGQQSPAPAARETEPARRAVMPSQPGVESAPAFRPGNEERHALPLPAVREMPRQPEAPPVRSAPVQQPPTPPIREAEPARRVIVPSAPSMESAPAFRPGNEERRAPPLPAMREMRREEREMPRQIEAPPRPREMAPPQPMPQPSPQPMRAPSPPPAAPAPMPAPPREASRPAGGNHDAEKARQREHDERGPH